MVSRVLRFDNGRSCCGDHAGLTLFAQAIAFPTNRNHNAMVEQSIEDGARCDFIAEDAIPLRDGTIRREQQTTLLITPGKQLIEQMPDFGR